VEFILKLYSLWASPPDLAKNKGKKLSLSEKRKAWSEEFFVDFEVFEEDIDPERTQILQLLSAHKKDKNFRDIDFAMLDRTRMILSCCLPYTPAPEENYVFNGKPEVQLHLSEDQKLKVDEQKQKKFSWLAIAKELIGLEVADDKAEERLLSTGTDSAEEALKEFADVWSLEIVKIYPLETLVSATVKSVIKTGVFVTLPDRREGFVHVSKINAKRFVDDATKSVKVGSAVTCKVIGYNPEKLQLLMSLATPENNPINRLKVKEVLEGEVLGLTDFGAFVSIGFGYQGMIHVSKLGRRVAKPSEVLRKGDRVSVEVLEIREDRGEARVALKLVQVLGS